MGYNYFYVQSFITKAMKILNGRVNHKVICYNYEFSIAESELCAYESYGRIMFYPATILEQYGFCRPELFKAYLLLIVVHELSHVDQLILYDRYKMDSKYRTDIENGANMNAFRFVSDNIRVLHGAFGNFDEFPIQELFNRLNPNTTRYMVGTDSELIKVAIEDYLLKDNKYRYDMFNSVTLNIEHSMLTYPVSKMTGKLELKHGHKIIDLKTLYPILYQVRRHRLVKVNNDIYGDHLVINISTESKQPLMNQVVRRN